MAGLPWFELDTDFPDHPKCRQLGRSLRNPVAFGYVVALYAYCYRHVTDRFESWEDVEEAAGWRGKSGVLVAALTACRFLDGDGPTYTVHGLAGRLAPHLAKRAKDRERVKKKRAAVALRLAAWSPECRSDVAATSGDSPRQQEQEQEQGDKNSDRRSVPRTLLTGSDLAIGKGLS